MGQASRLSPLGVSPETLQGRDAPADRRDACPTSADHVRTLSFAIAVQSGTYLRRSSTARPRPYPIPANRRQDAIVFAMSIAMVIGPTPPGTGVIARHFGATSANATSPTIR